MAGSSVLDPLLMSPCEPPSDQHTCYYGLGTLKTHFKGINTQNWWDKWQDFVVYLENVANIYIAWVSIRNHELQNI